jgi:hypothetical protein
MCCFAPDEQGYQPSRAERCEQRDEPDPQELRAGQGADTCGDVVVHRSVNHRDVLQLGRHVQRLAAQDAPHRLERSGLQTIDGVRIDRARDAGHREHRDIGCRAAHQHRVQDAAVR